MPNKFKYNKTGSEPNSLFKGNWAIDISGFSQGPTSTTGFYNGVDVPSNGYVVYNNGLAFTANSDQSLLDYVNSLGANVATIDSALVWIAAQNNILVVEREIESIVTDGLTLCLEADSVTSYPTSGNLWLDLSASGNNVTLVNGPTFSDKAIAFDGVNDYTALSSNFSDIFGANNQNTTISVWMNWTSTIRARIVNFYRLSTGSTGLSLVVNTSNGADNFAGAIGILFRNAANTGHIWDTYTGEAYNTGDWVNVAITTTATECKIYANGVLKKTVSQGLVQIPTGTFTGSLAAYKDSGATLNDNFNGNISSVFCYNRVLSADEILQNYNAQQLRFNALPLEGLKLYLDSRNSDSYSGGNVWYDLAQGIQFNAVSGTLPHLDIYGTQAFDFNGSYYWESASGHGLVDMAGDTTLIMWINSVNIGERDTIFEKAGAGAQSYEQEIAVTWETDEAFSWYSRRSTYDFGRTASIGTSGWHLVGIRMSSGKVQGQARQGWYSIDGQNWVENYTSRSTNSIIPAGPIRIGSGYAGPVEDGGIAVVAVWDRQLSDEEISDIWNRQRADFGV